MMVRRYCDSNEQINFFGRSNRSSMPPHLSREGVRSFAMPNRSLSPNHHDSEDDKSENPPRRRIALAVRNFLRVFRCFDTSANRGADTSDHSVHDVGKGRSSVVAISATAKAARIVRTREQSQEHVNF